MKITVLTHLEKEKDDKSYDVVIDQVTEGLRDLGHDATIFGVHGSIEKLTRGIDDRKPDLVFNLMETFGKGHLGAVPALGVLDLLKVPYTGGGPGEYYLQEDKAITKKLLAFDKIAYPDFAVFSLNTDMETGGNLRFPLFVKPLRMDASIGINGKSLVRNTSELMDRIAAIHKLRDSALAEEYIDGREFFVSVVGNNDPQALPVVEIDFTGFPPGQPKVLDAKAKWDPNSPRFKGTKSVFPQDLAPDVLARLERVALDAYRALRVRDYGRVDLRMAETGEIFVIEVNASCYLEKSSEFAMSAEKAGIRYPQLLQRIVDLALERQQKPGAKKQPAAVDPAKRKAEAAA